MAKRYQRGTTIIYDRIPGPVMQFILEKQLEYKLKSGRRKLSLGETLTKIIKPLIPVK